MPEDSSIPNTTTDEQAPVDQVAKKRRVNPVTISMPPEADAVAKLLGEDREAFVERAALKLATEYRDKMRA